MLFSGVSSLQAQSAGDIDTLSQWRVDVSWGSPQGMFYGYSKYYIAGDTLIDSHQYFQVYSSGYSYWYYGGPPPNYNYFDVYHAPLREENNIWYTVDDNNHDVLLFDFTLNVGDTVDSYANQMGEIIVIDSIDTIQVDGESKQRFHLSCDFGAEYIIEDIGATTGLWESLTWFENHSILHCFAKDFVPLWINPESGSCDLSVRIDEPEVVDNLSIYPNPFNTTSTIEYELTEPSHVQLTIYNAIGETIYVAEDGMMPQGKHTFIWSPERLPEGMYYAVLRSEEGVSVVKMIKQ
ncbi:MAG: T9SS type A sorting domain-containing protein [Bacteroidetes bacterium]|nr:T9SS type A sorting domain-containing protein [Bacteroidota bacterium]